MAGRTTLHLSLSLDGFAAGQDTSSTHPLGVGGEALHRWMFGEGRMRPDARDRAESEAVLSGAGAFVMGRRMFDIGEPLWGPDGAFGKPCFILTHRRRPALQRGPTRFDFEGNDLEGTLWKAKLAAAGRDVAIVGGPTTARQFLAAGLVDEMHLHLVPVSLGAGEPLFDRTTIALQFRPVSAAATDLAVHLVFVREDREAVSPV